jgi:hypothetical protein
MGKEELIEMKDNDGTPLSKKAETISYSDIYSTPDDKPRVSINKAYAEGAHYVDDPTYTEKGTKSFTQNVKDKFNAVKSKVTVQNLKRVGSNAVQNAGRSMNEFEVVKPARTVTPVKFKAPKKQKKANMDIMQSYKDPFSAPKTKPLKRKRKKQSNMNDSDGMFELNIFNRKGGLY